MAIGIIRSFDKFISNRSDVGICCFFAVVAFVTLVMLQYFKPRPQVKIYRPVYQVTAYDKVCKCDIKYPTDTLVYSDGFAYFKSNGDHKIIDIKLIKDICYK